MLYVFTTPVSIGIGMAARRECDCRPVDMVSGVLDSVSAGILIYTELVELLARDFLLDPKLRKKTAREKVWVVFWLCRCWAHGVAWEVGLICSFGV